MKSDTLDTAAPSLSPEAQRQVGMPKAPPRGWLSPRVPVIVICFVGVVLLALLLALNAASPGDRPVIRITCCYDAPSYFSTGHALLFHHSFDLTSEFKVIGQPNEGWSATVPATGKPASVFAIGYSLLEIPFIAAGTAVDSLTHHPADGYSRYALTFYYGANILFVTVGMACLYLFLYGLGGSLPISQGSRTWIPLFVTLALLPTTTLGYYTFSPLPHAAGFMTLSIFLLAWWHTRNSNNVWRWVLLGMIGALAALCRWQNAIYLAAPPLCDMVSWYTTGPLPGKTTFPRWVGVRALYSAVALSSLIPQLIEWKSIFGQYLLVPQGPGFFEFPPRFVQNVLFSSQHGWFIWTPVTLLCLIGLVMGTLRLKAYLLPWTVILFAMVVLIGSQPSDWHCNESFGIRSLTCSLPVAAIGLAMLFWMSSRKMQPVLWSLVAICGIFTVLFAAQYRLDLLPKNDRLVSTELIRDKFHLSDALARDRSARKAAALVKKGDSADAINLLNAGIQKYGEDRVLLKTLTESYSAAGDTAAAQEANARLQHLLGERLF